MTKTNTVKSTISQSKLEKIVKPWLSDIVQDDIVAVMGYPQSDIRMIFLEMTGNSRLLKKYGINSGKFLFLTLDFRIDHLDDALDMEEFIINKLKQYHLINLSSDNDLDTILKTFNKIIVITAFGCEKLIDRRKTALLQWLSMMANYTTLRTLLFFDINLFSESPRKFFSQVTEFHPHMHFLRLFDKEASQQYIEYLSGKWKLNIDEKLGSQVILSCGGHHILMKEVLRSLRQHSEMTLESIFNSSEVQLVLSTIFYYFRDEQILLKQIAQGTVIDKESQQELLRYLVEIGLVRYGERSIEIAIPLLSKFILKELLKHKKITVENNIISVSDIPISANFSKREHAVLLALLENPHKLFSRGKIAAILWPKKKGEKYSEWALDSHVSRIRQKLVNIGLPKSIITSKKGQGIILEI